MQDITQEMIYREAVLRYAEKYSVLKAAARYNESTKNIYRWRKRWLDGGKDISSLKNTSRARKTQATAHTKEELALLRKIRVKEPNIGLQDLWSLARKQGYTRSMSGCARALERLGLPTCPKIIPSPTCRPRKPRRQMTYPGERIQVDVKIVPDECLSLDLIRRHPHIRLYQYTAIDEYTRLRTLAASDSYDLRSSSLFLGQIVAFFGRHGVKVERILTDNGRAFVGDMTDPVANSHNEFEQMARHFGIRLERIRPYHPAHNAKVERSHREDQRLLYSEIIRKGDLITDMADFKKRLKKHQIHTNDRPMQPLGLLSPLEYLERYKHEHPF